MAVQSDKKILTTSACLFFFFFFGHKENVKMIFKKSENKTNKQTLLLHRMNQSELA